jgi:hypothetical protein
MKPPVVKTYESYLAQLKQFSPSEPFPYGGTIKEEIDRINGHLKALRKKSLTK